ncbi:MAG TPA: ethanolamine ammonia-lyase subunit EutC [Gemmataceae bacterium]|jgi:ethanolamine ammonia-lyase small subunit|nr:ethanolamine ammonia-lyase subunit EutC [Gemmataceae bacterium]
MSNSDLPAGRLPAPAAELPELMRAILARTPARVLVGRAGPAYRTATQLELRRDHAAAVDAVHAGLDPVKDLGRAFVKRWQLFEVCTRAGTRTEYLMRPDLGRRLDDAARGEVAGACTPGADLQVVIGDGLSATAVAVQVPAVLPFLEQGARQRGWGFGRPFLVRYCRVGVLNDVGELLDPRVAVLLIGERPGLATAESLSAYMAYRPRPGHTDAQRNLISNIHARGVAPEAAAWRILALAEKMRQLQTSGVAVKEDLPPLLSPGAPARPGAAN